MPCRCTFCPISCLMASSCLLQFSAVRRMACTSTVNFLLFIRAAVLTAGSQLGSCSSLIFVSAMSVVISTSPLGSLLATSTFPGMDALLHLLIPSTIWLMGRSRSCGDTSGSVTMSSRASLVGVSRSAGRPFHAGSPALSTAAKDGAAAGVEDFFWLRISPSTARVSLATCTLSTWICGTAVNCAIPSLSSVQASR